MTRQIKIHVNPEQSVIIQKICFENAICWACNGKVVSNIDAPYLFIGSTYLDCSGSGSDYKDSPYIEIDAQQFISSNINYITTTNNVKLKVTLRQNEMLVKHCERLHIDVDTYTLDFADLPRYDLKDTYFFIDGHKNIYYTSASQDEFTNSDFLEFTYEAFIANEPKYGAMSYKGFNVASVPDIVEPCKKEHEISFADICSKGIEGIFGITLSPETYVKLSEGNDLELVIKLKGKPADKWKAKTKFFQICSTGSVNASANLYDNEHTFNPGFNSKSYAEMVADKVYKLKVIYSWLEENDDGWQPDWNDKDQAKYYIVYNHNSKMYIIQTTHTFERLTCVYMSIDNAHKLCDLLNNGLIKLTCRD